MTKGTVTPFHQGQGFNTCFDKQNNDSWELRRQKQDRLENDTFNKRSQQPAAKRQAMKDQNETQPAPKDPQLTTKDRDSNSAVAIMVGEVSTQKGGLSTLTERSKGSSSTLSSSKKEWVVHLGIVKSAFQTNIPKKWIQDHKFCHHLLADRVL